MTKLTRDQARDYVANRVLGFVGDIYENNCPLVAPGIWEVAETLAEVDSTRDLIFVLLNKPNLETQVRLFEANNISFQLSCDTILQSYKVLQFGRSFFEPALEDGNRVGRSLDTLDKVRKNIERLESNYGTFVKEALVELKLIG